MAGSPDIVTPLTIDDRLVGALAAVHHDAAEDPALLTDSWRQLVRSDHELALELLKRARELHTSEVDPVKAHLDTALLVILALGRVAGAEDLESSVFGDAA